MFNVIHKFKVEWERDLCAPRTGGGGVCGYEEVEVGYSGEFCGGENTGLMTIGVKPMVQIMGTGSQEVCSFVFSWQGYY